MRAQVKQPSAMAAGGIASQGVQGRQRHVSAVEAGHPHPAAGQVECPQQLQTLRAEGDSEPAGHTQELGEGESQ